jgi:O-antigen ligase
MIAFRAKLWMFLPLTICSATFFCVLTLTWTRGAFVALGVGLICFLYPIIKRRRLAAIITIAIITALIFFACVHRSSSFQDKFLAQRSAFSRVTYLKDNLGRIEHNFLLGTGINRDPNASFVGMQTAGAFFSKSLVLSMMVEMGVFGLILFVAAFIGIAGSVASVKGPLLRNSLKATWIVLFAASLFDVPVLCWSRPDGNMLLGFLIGTTLLAVNRSQRPRKLSVIRT